MAEPSSTTRGSTPGADPAVDLAALIDDLSEQLRTTARLCCAALVDLEPLVDHLADLEARLCAARHRAGIYHDVRSPARELAADIVHGHLHALRPYVPFVTGEAARRAEDALVGLAATTTRGDLEAASHGR